MSADVIDMRPDRFLRVLRDTADWAQACEKAGYSASEVEELCAVNARFDLSQVECQLQFHEEKIIEATEAAIVTARQNRDTQVKNLREVQIAAWRERHPQRHDDTLKGADVG